MLAEALSPRTKAVMVAHTLGNPFDIDAVLDFCEANGLWLVEDNCDAMGSEYTTRRGEAEPRPVGPARFGHLATSSFYPAHQMTTGEGGAVYTSDEELASIAESIRDWGRDCYCQPGRSNTCGKRFGWSLGTLPEGYDHKYTYSHFGYNLKMTDMQAAVGVAQLEKLPSFVAARRRNFDYFHQRLAPFGEVLRLPEPTPHSTPSWFGFLAVVEARDARSPGTAWWQPSKGPGSRPGCCSPATWFASPASTRCGQSGTGFRQIGDLPNTDRLMNDAFWFGVYPGMTEAHLDHICSTIERHLGAAASMTGEDARRRRHSLERVPHGRSRAGTPPAVVPSYQETRVGPSVPVPIRPPRCSGRTIGPGGRGLGHRHLRLVRDRRIPRPQHGAHILG